MNLRTHSKIEGRHAFLSPSSYHWLNYDDQKLAARWHTARSAARGTDLHNLAHQAIKLGIKLSTADKTMSAYVRDGIGYRMQVEQPLFYSENCFGHADTLSFRNNKLRIHDLKTGMAKTSEHQLEVYAALFCLEYGVDPWTIEIELRIYQNGEVHKFFPTPDLILHVMDRIIYCDAQIELMKESEDL